MKITLLTTDVAIPLAAFIRAHWKGAADWSDDSLLRWVRWALSEQFLAYCLDETEIVGLGIARPVMHAEDGAEHGVFDHEGSCIFVDLAIGTRPGALALLVALTRRRFGLREKIAYLRGDDERLVIQSFDRVHAQFFGNPRRRLPVVKATGRTIDPKEIKEIY